MASTIRGALDSGLNLQALDLARNASTGDATPAEILYLGALASARKAEMSRKRFAPVVIPPATA